MIWQPHSKTARVGDVSVAAEHAFGAGKDKETTINNNALGAGSAVSSDSGVWTGGEGAPGGDLSPSSRRRPRNLEMVMKGSHSFHLRELDDDLDIMVTGHTVIPLPKLPSSFDELSPLSPDYEVDPVPSYRAPSPILPKPCLEVSRSPMSTLDRYRNRSRPTRIQTSSDEE
ncbi:putative serine/threonine-protein kinase, partial [Operophtera brumata]